MRICTTLALALVLATAGACKKDNQDSGGNTKVTDNKTDQGSAGSAQTPPPPPPEPEKPLDGQGLAKRYIECGELMMADTAKFQSKCIAPDATMTDAAMRTEMKVSDMSQGMETWKKAFPDMKMTPQFIFVNGRSLAAVSFSQGTHTGELDMTSMGMGKIAPTNKKFGQLFFQRIKFNDENKATHDWFIEDHGQMGQILGVAPPDVPFRPVMEKPPLDAPVIVVAADNDVEKANLAFWKQGLEAINAHKAKDLVAMFADDAVESDQAEPADTKGKKDLQKGTEMFFKAFPDMKIEETEVWAAGDYVVFIGTAKGTNTGPLGKMKKTGKAVEMPFAEVAEIKDGKIAKLWRFRNGVDMARQLGLIPPMPAPGAGSAAPADPKGAAPADPKGAAAPADPAAAPTGTKADDKKADTK
jgi:predicted ester cyclase